jgi:hypothetical protein
MVILAPASGFAASVVTLLARASQVIDATPKGIGREPCYGSGGDANLAQRSTSMVLLQLHYFSGNRSKGPRDYRRSVM